MKQYEAVNDWRGKKPRTVFHGISVTDDDDDRLSAYSWLRAELGTERE